MMLHVFTEVKGNLLPSFPLLHCSTLKMEAAISLQNVVTFYQTTQCHIPEDNAIHIHCHENLKSHNVKINLQLIEVLKVMTLCSMVESYQCVWRNLLSPFLSSSPRFHSEDGGSRFLLANGNISLGFIMSQAGRR